MLLRLLLIIASLVHGVSFGMVVRYRDKEAKKRVESSVRQYLAKQEICIERERWKNVPEKQQAIHKLIRLYEKQDKPKFVARYLKNQDVPIFLVQLNDAKTFSLDPYVKDFYKNADKQIFETDPEIIKIGRSKIEKIQKKHSSDYQGSIYQGSMGSLGSSILLGKDEDIAYECGKLDEALQGHNLFLRFIHCGAIACAVKYSFVKNNAIALLLQREKQLSAPLMDEQSRCDSGYILLKEGVQNKEAFELIAHTDPYSSNRMLYVSPFNLKLTTHLDSMKKVDSDTFDQEYIDIFVREGGMSAKEVECMNQVDRILQGKKTLEEIAAENTWKQIINDSNSDNSNKYMESQILLRVVQEREEAERISNERQMMMTAFVRAMLRDGDI